MIDVWTGPPPTPQQFPPNEPNGIRKLLDKIAALETQLRESTSNLLGSAGIRLTRAGMFIDSSLTVGGDLATTGHTTIGGVDVVQDLIDKQAALTSQLASINDIISKQVAGDSASASVTNFSTTATATSKVTTSIAVPAGYSQALVFASGIAGMWNSNATYEYIYLSVLIAGSATSRDNTIGMPPGSYNSTSTAKATHLTGLSGGSISFSVSLRTDTPVAANATNRAYIEATAVFLR